MILEMNNLSCGYDKKAVVKNINATVSPGDICCILGENGVGKSTLFKTILKLLDPIEGNVSIDGERIEKLSHKKLATKMAYVAQSHTPPFPYSVEEVITMGRMIHMSAFSSPSKKDKEIVDKIIDDMEIGFLRNNAYNLISGGERQLVMIAKALAQEPQCLVLDEPTANLDYGNKVIVLNTIKKLAEKGISIVFTTHDPEQALLLNAKTIILFKNDPALSGKANSIVNEKTLKAAYDADIRVVEIVDDKGNPVRVCLPLLN